MSGARHTPLPETYFEQEWRDEEGELAFHERNTFAGTEEALELERMIPPGTDTVETDDPNGAVAALDRRRRVLVGPAGFRGTPGVQLPRRSSATAPR